MTTTKATQSERVLDYADSLIAFSFSIRSAGVGGFLQVCKHIIEQFGSITQLEALKDLGVMRLASRISDLKKQGYPIKSEIEAVKNRFEETCHIKRYSLAVERGAENG